METKSPRESRVGFDSKQCKRNTKDNSMTVPSLNTSKKSNESKINVAWRKETKQMKIQEMQATIEIPLKIQSTTNVLGPGDQNQLTKLCQSNTPHCCNPSSDLLLEDWLKSIFSPPTVKSDNPLEHDAQCRTKEVTLPFRKEFGCPYRCFDI